MPSRFKESYKVSVTVFPRLQHRGYSHCRSCGIRIKIGDWVERTFGNIYHKGCLKRI